MKKVVRLVIAAATCTAIALPWVVLVKTVQKPPPAQVLRAQGIVWDDRVFVDRAAFAAWLQSRGRSYEAWAKRHPSQASGATSTTSTSSKATTSAAATSKTTGAETPAGSGVAHRLAPFVWLVFGLVLVLGFVAAVVRSLRRLGSDPMEDVVLTRENEWQSRSAGRSRRRYV